MNQIYPRTLENQLKWTFMMLWIISKGSKTPRASKMCNFNNWISPFQQCKIEFYYILITPFLTRTSCNSAGQIQHKNNGNGCCQCPKLVQRCENFLGRPKYIISTTGLHHSNNAKLILLDSSRKTLKKGRRRSCISMLLSYNRG
jgi:hypothetical protein